MKRNAFSAFLLTVALSVSAALAQGPGGGGFNPGGGGFNPGGGDQPGGGGGSLVYDDFITACTTNAGIVLRDGIAIGTTAAATSLTAPAGMTAILPGAFAGNTAITSANLSAAAGLTEIPASAFAGCTALKTVTLPSSVTTIGDGAFEGCTALAALTASGVETIGANAFRGCTALGTQPAGTAIGDYAFAQSGLTSVSLASATLGEGVCYGCASLASATFPETLPDATFGGCTALSIDPSGLVSIGAAALAGVPFSEVTFAASEMGGYAVAADTAWEAWTMTWAGTAATNATTFLGRGEAPGDDLAPGGTVETSFASVSDIQIADGVLSLALGVADDLSAASVSVYVTDDLLSGTWREATEAAVTVSGTSISIEGIATGDTSKLFLRFGLE